MRRVAWLANCLQNAEIQASPVKRSSVRMDRARIYASRQFNRRWIRWLKRKCRDQLLFLLPDIIKLELTAAKRQSTARRVFMAFNQPNTRGSTSATPLSLVNPGYLNRSGLAARSVSRDPPEGRPGWWPGRRTVSLPTSGTTCSKGSALDTAP